LLLFFFSTVVFLLSLADPAMIPVLGVALTDKDDDDVIIIIIIIIGMYVNKIFPFFVCVTYSLLTM
jgi:hypothetical protein